MPTIKKRVTFTMAASLMAGLCGTVAGYLLALAITVKVTENRLDGYAALLNADDEASSAELRTVLAAAGASQNPPCSDAEIRYFRALIFESDYLKDVGRMKGGGIQCSALLGLRAKLLVPAQPDFVQPDGTAIYKSLGPYRDGDQTPMAVELGGTYVVFTPLNRMHLESAPMHYLETVTDSRTGKPGQLLGEWPNAGFLISTAAGRSRLGNSFYVTRCSIRSFGCVTAYTALPEMLSVNRTRFLLFVALSGLGGAFLGSIFSLLYRRNHSMEQQLRRAVGKGQLQVVYQPLVNLHSGLMVGAEALVRWSNEQGAPVGPDVFVRLAEERGFVGEITRLVVRRVLCDMGRMLERHPGFHISINVAPADLSDPEFLPMLDGEMKRAKVSAHSVSIELTESATARHKAAIETIRFLRQRGHSVHIDDFGTGYSSLAYLHELSVDAIKIDRAFTQAIGTGSAGVAILPQILAMAEALNLGVIVEGIETGAQAEYFASVDDSILAQGWLFGRPDSARVLLDKLAEQEKLKAAQVEADPAPDSQLIHTA